MFTFAPCSGSWIFWFLETHRLYLDWAPPDPCVNGDVLWDLRSAFPRGEYFALLPLAKASGLFRLVGSLSDCCLPFIYSVFVKHVPIAFYKSIYWVGSNYFNVFEQYLIHFSSYCPISIFYTHFHMNYCSFINHCCKLLHFCFVYGFLSRCNFHPQKNSSHTK